MDKGKSGTVKVQIVYDLSCPQNQLVNAYTNIYKQNFWYRSIPTAPRYWRLHVLEWQSMVNLDLQLPFGVRAAQGVFDRPTQAIVRSTQRVGSEM